MGGGAGAGANGWTAGVEGHLKPGRKRRVSPRFAVDCAASVRLLSGAGEVHGRMVELGLGGCRITAERQVPVGILARVEVQFELRGMLFRIVGVTAGSRTGKSVAVRFLEMPPRRLEELTGVIAELAEQPPCRTEELRPEVGLENAEPSTGVRLGEARLRAAQADDARTLASSTGRTGTGRTGTEPTSSTPPSTTPPSTTPPSTIGPQRKRTDVASERRSHGRHAVNTQANLFLVSSAVSMAGRILNLSEGGCRLRTEAPFSVGVFARLEAEFYLHGLPFRIAGVSQAILDRNTIGVRFLEMSERRREQLKELMAELDEAESAARRGAL